MPTTLKWKWPTKMYGSIHTRSRDLGINRCKTQEKDGGGEEARVESNVHDKEVKQSTTTKVDACNKEVKQSTTTKDDACDKDAKQKHDNGQFRGLGGFEGYSREVISTSNKEDTSTGIVVNSNARVYHKSGQSPKHAMWSLKVIGMSIRLKEGLLGVLDVGI